MATSHRIGLKYEWASRFAEPLCIVSYSLLFQIFSFRFGKCEAFVVNQSPVRTVLDCADSQFVKGSEFHIVPERFQSSLFQSGDLGLGNADFRGNLHLGAA